MTKKVLSILPVLFLALNATASADHRPWTSLPCDDTCIGGDSCGSYYGETLSLPLDARPVVAVRFYAHDRVGSASGGKLRVLLDDVVVRDDVDVKKDGSGFEIDLHGRRGRHLELRAITDDEVVVETVKVLYGRKGRH